MPENEKSGTYIDWLLGSYAAVVRSKYTLYITVTLVLFGLLQVTPVFVAGWDQPGYFGSASLALGVGLALYCIHLGIERIL